MFREMLKLLTKTGKRDLIISSVFFALYGLSSIAMIVIVFSILFQIFDGTSLDMLYKYFIAIGLLVVFKGICNMVADMKKHSAGFDIVQQIRERMIIKLKKLYRISQLELYFLKAFLPRDLAMQSHSLG